MTLLLNPHGIENVALLMSKPHKLLSLLHFMTTGGSEEYFKYDPAISLCSITLICFDSCPVPVFVHGRILFLFLLTLSSVLRFSR